MRRIRNKKPITARGLDPGNEKVQRRDDVVPAFRQIRHLGAECLPRNAGELWCDRNVHLPIDLEGRSQNFDYSAFQRGRFVKRNDDPGIQFVEQVALYIQ